MANIGKWSLSAVGLTTVMSTELNSLASGSQATSSGTFANQTNQDILFDVEILLASLSPTTGAFVGLFLLESVDGTNFPGQSASDLRLTVTQLLVNIPIGVTAATAQRVVARGLTIPPALVKFVFDNQTGAALNASGNLVRILPYDYNLNG